MPTSHLQVSRSGRSRRSRLNSRLSAISPRSPARPRVRESETNPPRTARADLRPRGNFVIVRPRASLGRRAPDPELPRDARRRGVRPRCGLRRAAPVGAHSAIEGAHTTVPGPWLTTKTSDTPIRASGLPMPMAAPLAGTAVAQASANASPSSKVLLNSSSVKERRVAAST